jgi:hypothetical protein
MKIAVNERLGKLANGGNGVRTSKKKPVAPHFMAFSRAASKSYTGATPGGRAREERKKKHG